VGPALAGKGRLCWIKGVIEIEKQEKRRKYKDMVLVFWKTSFCGVNISKQKQALTQPICGDSSEFIREWRVEFS
jgi:hypothetical protein